MRRLHWKRYKGEEPLQLVKARNIISACSDLCTRGKRRKRLDYSMCIPFSRCGLSINYAWQNTCRPKMNLTYPINIYTFHLLNDRKISVDDKDQHCAISNDIGFSHRIREKERWIKQMRSQFYVHWHKSYGKITQHLIRCRYLLSFGRLWGEVLKMQGNTTSFPGLRTIYKSHRFILLHFNRINNTVISRQIFTTNVNQHLGWD